MISKEQKDREFTQLVEKMRNPIFAVALRYLRSREEAEEAAQQTLCLAYEKMHLFRGESSVETWVNSILKNVCTNRLVKRSQKARFVPIETGDEAHNVEDAESNPGLIMEREEELKRIRIFIRQLPKAEAEIVELFYIDDLGYEDIATLLGITSGTVASSLWRARAKFRGLYRVKKGGENR
jgi:RNA polymerase sigma-70 factor, ECF subfamily